MNTNTTLRVIGLVAAIVMLTLAGVLPHIVLLLSFLGAFTLHYISDLEGDMFFTDEPLGVAITRHVGFGLSVLLGVIGLIAGFPTWAFVVSYLAGLGTHLVGDILSVKEQIMAFDFASDVVIYPFLGWVGLKAADIAASYIHGNVTKTFVMVGLAIAETGLIAAYRIYRDGNDPASFNADPAPKA